MTKISEKRLAANRANAQKSTGPKTPAGKAASSRNALTHGLCASTFLVLNEDFEECSRLRQEYFARFHPVDQVEYDLVDRMAHATWNMRRSWTLANELFNLQMIRMEADIAAQYDDFPERTRLAAALDELAKQPALPLLHRYEARLSTEYQRALRTLLDLRKSCPPQPHPDPEPVADPQAVAEPSAQTNPPPPQRFKNVCRYTLPLPPAVAADTSQSNQESHDVPPQKVT